jgi:hypothetical protein
MQFARQSPGFHFSESVMSVRTCFRILAPPVAAALVWLIWATPAPAQMRGMMPMQPSMPMTTMPGGMPMMRPSVTMPNAQMMFLINVLRQREMFFLAAQQQVEAQIAVLAARPPSAARNALLVTARQQEAALAMAVQQIGQQLAALQR